MSELELIKQVASIITNAKLVARQPHLCVISTEELERLRELPIEWLDKLILDNSEAFEIFGIKIEDELISYKGKYVYFYDDDGVFRPI